MFICRTPYRLSLYGGGIDYPSWYEKRDIQVLCAGLDYYCYQTVRELPPFFKHKYRIAYSKIEEVNDINEIQHPTAREVIREFGDEKSMGSSEMGKIISSTHFIPCPNGFHHPETYRLYEALELGCIPIVESTYEYYKSIFPNHPFFTVEKWADGKKIVEECGDKQILNKRESCKKW